MNFPFRRRARAVSARSKIFSSKKFSRVVVYCSVIKVPVVLSSDSFNILSKLFSFVKNFFIFLLSPTGQLRYSTIYFYHLSTVFYKFFQLFLPVSIRHYIWYFYMILSYNFLIFYTGIRQVGLLKSRWDIKNYRDLSSSFSG